MDENHPKEFDARPKRRRDVINPYKVYSVGVDTDRPRYFVSFTDYLGVQHKLEIDKPLFEAFDQFELDDLSFFNEIDRHYDRFELSETFLNARAVQQPEIIDEVVMKHIQNERLHQAIATLPEKQRRRLILYFFGEFTYEQIAKKEKCTLMPVKRSIDAAIKKLKQILE